MTIRRDVSLRPFNSFGLEAKSRFFVALEHPDDLLHLMQQDVWHEPRMVLGGGSNVLFAGDFDGLILHNRLQGRELLHQDAESVVLRVASGENWHCLVQDCVEQGWSGLENLALIPGSVGAAPMQNIGAYGAELQDCCQSVSVCFFRDGGHAELSREQCRFGYRDSIFKHELKDKCLITAVTLRLHRRFQPNLRYAALQQHLQAGRQPTLREVFDAVVTIRQSKLPDPAVLGNAGSFFKNPVIAADQAEQLRAQFPGIPLFVQAGQHKVPAAWLIEQCGWKGKRLGAVGAYEKQPLVLVNYGGASGAELLELAGRIRRSVYERFGIVLEPEVNIIGGKLAEV